MSISELRDRLSTTLLEFARDEWAQMGVFIATQRRDTWAQDPEALLVFTFEIARDDARLFDEVLDWLRTNGEIVSGRRLAALAKHDPALPIVEAAVEWAAQHGSPLRLGSGIVAQPAEPVALFRNAGLPGRSDETFLAHGLLKPPTEPSGKSSAPNLELPINLAFRLRHHFGVNARAEIVRFLLTSGVQNATALAISAAAASTKRNVTNALASLSAAGDVERVWVGNEARYSIDRERWAAFLGLDPDRIPSHRDWPQLLHALAEMRRWFLRSDLEELSAYQQASEARQLMQRLAPSLTHAGISISDTGTGADYWSTFVENVESALAAIDSARHP
jgi:hypothetical protein